MTHRDATVHGRQFRRLISCGLLVLAAALLAAQESTADWRLLYKQNLEAHQNKNYEVYRQTTYSLLDRLNGHSDTILAAAGAEALAGNRLAAMRWLKAYAQTGLYKDLSAEQDLASLRDDPEFRALQRDLDKNRTAVSLARKWTGLPIDLVPEDIAFDRDRERFLVTSIRQRQVVWVDRGGNIGPWLRPGQDGLWAVFAIGIDQKRNRVWITTEAVPHAPGYREADKDRPALLAYDLATARLLTRLELPDREGAHGLGDLTVGPDGTVFVSDGKAGRIYRATIHSSALELFVDKLGSPQGPTLSPAGNVLYVADYVLGIVAIDLKTKAVTPLKHPLHIPLNGIDCLMSRGHQLVAVQNGTDPVRVLVLDLDDSGTRVLRSHAMESSPAELGSPTHGTLRGNRFYYLANTGLDNFNEKGELIPGKKLTPPRIMYFDLK